MKEEGLQTRYFFFIVDLASQLADHLTFRSPILNGLKAPPLAEVYVIGIVNIHIVFGIVIVFKELEIAK